MAQTKTRTQKKSSSGRAKSGSGSSRKGSTKKTTSRSKSTSRAKSTGRSKASSRSRNSGGSKSGSSRSRSTSGSKSSGTKRKSTPRANTSQQATANSGGVMEKVKGPATMAGVALIGVAGGIAAVRNGSKGRSGLLSGIRGSGLSLPSARGVDLGKALDGISLPKSDGSTMNWVEEKARSLGDAGYRVADPTEQARRIQKGSDSS